MSSYMFVVDVSCGVFGPRCPIRSNTEKNGDAERLLQTSLGPAPERLPLVSAGAFCQHAVAAAGILERFEETLVPGRDARTFVTHQTS